MSKPIHKCPVRPRAERRGRPRLYPSRRCQPRVALDASEYKLFELAAKTHSKPVPYVIALAAKFGFKQAVQHIAGVPRMEDAV